MIYTKYLKNKQDFETWQLVITLKKKPGRFMGLDSMEREMRYVCNPLIFIKK